MAIPAFFADQNTRTCDFTYKCCQFEFQYVLTILLPMANGVSTLWGQKNQQQNTLTYQYTKLELISTMTLPKPKYPFFKGEI